MKPAEKLARSIGKWLSVLRGPVGHGRLSLKDGADSGVYLLVRFMCGLYEPGTSDTTKTRGNPGPRAFRSDGTYRQEPAGRWILGKGNSLDGSAA